MPIPKPVADFIVRWGALMSGAPSIPFVIWGALVDQAYQRYSLWVLAYVTILLSYFIGHKQLTARIQELEDKLRPRLKLSYAADKTEKGEGGHRFTFLRITNESEVTIESVLPQIIESRFKPEGPGSWRSTSIVANMNMSWCGIPEALHVQKYSARSLPPGSELVDFVSGPHTDTDTPPCFVIRIDPAHSEPGFVNPQFTTKGVYKFVMQVSGP